MSPLATRQKTHLILVTSHEGPKWYIPWTQKFFTCLFLVEHVCPYQFMDAKTIHHILKQIKNIRIKNNSEQKRVPTILLCQELPKFLQIKLRYFMRRAFIFFKVLSKILSSNKFMNLSVFLPSAVPAIVLGCQSYVN